ncbi:glycosyl transferase family 1 [Erwinia sp. E_sp_B04_7]|uniref:HVO_A0114 family putative DNA-binding protein n=1 Tax=unclassified Erwinia TaxID=2622719 RepID=UPI0030D11DFD
MTTVTIRIASLEEVKRSTLAALKGEKAAEGNVISFLTFDELHKTLTPKKMAILNAMTGAGELTFRAIAGLINRDVKAVHTDVTALIKCGIIDKTDAGCLFPYEAIHFDFTLYNKAA